MVGNSGANISVSQITAASACNRSGCARTYCSMCSPPTSSSPSIRNLTFLALDNVNLLHAHSAQFIGQELARATNVRPVLRQSADAGDFQQVREACQKSFAA